MQYCVYAHALSCTEHMSRKRIWSLKWQTKTKKKKLAIYRAWPWISNCWKWDSNSGLSGIESSALTTRPSRLGANLRRDATSRLLFLDQSVLADFDPRKKKEPHFKTRSLSGTSKKYGLTVFGVLAAVGTVIGVIVSNLKAGLTNVAKGVGNGLKELGKKLGKILPGMVGAIVSFLFKAAGEAVGFLAKHAWLLIMLVVTFAVEQFKN